jgi:hypothetical protein
MLSPSLTKKITHGQTSVAAADDDRLDQVIHRDFL